jgi:hypothetical protein
MHGLLGGAIVSASRAGVDERGDLDREEAAISYSPLRFSFLSPYFRCSFVCGSWWEQGGKKPVDENSVGGIRNTGILFK